MKFGQNLGTALIVGLVYLRTPWNPNDMPYDQVDAFNINGAIFRKKFKKIVYSIFKIIHIIFKSIL